MIRLCLNQIVKKHFYLNHIYWVYRDNHQSGVELSVNIRSQVKHMASLLSESEAENARHIQLAQVLKEEIRSYRRSEERSKHIENLEYVKNVILKVVIVLI